MIAGSVRVSSLGLFPGSTAPTCWCQIRSASFGELRQSRWLSAWPAALLFVEPRPAYIRPRRAADRGEYRQAAGAIAEAVIRSVELIVQPAAKDAVGEMAV